MWLTAVFSCLHLLLAIQKPWDATWLFLCMVCEVPPLMLGWISFWVLALLCLILKGISHLHPQRKSPQHGRPISGNTALPLLLPAEQRGYQGSADPRAGITRPSLSEPSSHRPWEGCSVVSPVIPASVSALSSQAASHLLNSREGSRLGLWRPEFSFWICNKLALCLVGKFHYLSEPQSLLCKIKKVNQMISETLFSFNHLESPVTPL